MESILELKDVSFAYDETKYTLKNVNASFPSWGICEIWHKFRDFVAYTTDFLLSLWYTTRKAGKEHELWQKK